MKFSIPILVLFFEIVSAANRRISLSCPEISLKNGKYRMRQRGRYVEFTCNPGYFRAGERHSLCVRKQWSPPPPKCVRPTCPNKVQNPTNGQIYPSHNGAALHFFCNPGYALHGPTDVFCDGTKWDNNAPICLPAYEKPKLFCNFEDPQICGWTPDLNHDFDWRRENYQTPSGSIGTGPSFDHTKGIGQNGYYMYIESSSRNENDTARLISPIFDKIDSEVCFEFYYHMFGGTIGSLRVYLKKESEDWNLKPEQMFFSQSGNKGDKWYRSLSPLGTIDEEFQIIIEGVRGSGYVSDIAIDDVKIIPNCTGETDFSTTTMESVGTEIVPVVDSCDNRCGQTEGKINDTYHLTCDCDDDCYINNRCCPDYFDYCLNGTTDVDIFSTEFTTEPVTTTIKPTTKFNITTPKLTTKTTKLPPTTRNATVTTTKLTTKTTTPKLTTRKIITIKKTTVTPTTTKRTTSIPQTTRKRIIIKTPPTTPKIIRKTLKPTTIKIEDKDRRPPYKPYYHGKESEKDYEEVTVPKNNDLPLYITSPFPDFIDNRNDVGKILTHKFDERSKTFSQTSTEPRVQNQALVVVIAVVVVVSILGLTLYILVRRYRNPVARIRYSAKEGLESEVTFLTEENLDLSLDDDL